VQVGPTRPYRTPSAAARAAKDGDTIEIDAGEYRGDVAVWRAHGLTIRGVKGIAHLKAEGNSAEQKALWVIKGNDAVVEQIEFSGCHVPDRNGAGIRHEGRNLTLRHCCFHDNEDGLLTGADPKSDILIEHTEFGRNGAGDGFSHNIYVGNVHRLTMRFCWSHHARTGHLVKSRAAENLIQYNRLMDEKDGTSSYVIDLPNGGRSFVIGNIIQHGPAAENAVAVSYAAEGASHPLQELYVVNNTFVNERKAGGCFLRVAGTNPKVLVVNNLVVGTTAVLKGPGEVRNNLATDKPGFVDGAGYDYQLKADSPAIGAGDNPGKVEDFGLMPVFQYRHPLDKQERVNGARPNVGAF
jgi:hypothetical protein